MFAVRISTRCRVAALFLSFAWFTACGASNEPSDQALTDSVSARLSGAPEIAPYDLDVDVDEGIVTLDGTVQTESERMAAERIARSTAGVRGVTNEIDVEGSPPATSPPAVGAPPPAPPPGASPGAVPPADVD